jgi:riboflavin kinase/FMN adenylyltransferase
MEFAAITAEDFVADILVGGLKASHVVVGENFVFGHRRRGNVEVLKDLAGRHGFGVDCVSPVRDGGEMVSSGRIRDLLRGGDVKSAAQALGRFWEIEARVEHGDARGRDLGFATANLRMAEHLNPAFGIYVVRAGVDAGGETVWHDGVASFGLRPTFGGTEPLFEVHLFDFDADIYGRHLRVRLVDYLRAEEKFDGVEALVAQMEKDAAAARRILAEVDAGPSMENSAAASP